MIWAEKDEIEMDRDNLLHKFKEYRNDVLVKRKPHDNAQLINRVSPDNGGKNIIK